LFQVPVRLDVIRALAKIASKDAAVRASMNRIVNQDKDGIMRLWAAAVLIRTAPTGSSAQKEFGLLVDTLRHVGKDEQMAATVAAEALGVIGSEAAIATLIGALNAKDISEWGRIRASVAKALGETGPPAKGAVESLRKALSEEQSFRVWREAIVALGKIGPSAKAALPDLIRLATSDDTFFNDLADEAIEKIGDDEWRQHSK
jgi:HEAT repeat protein